MVENADSADLVQLGSTKDLAAILSWLESEHREDHFGFWVNHDMVVNAQKAGELWVVRRCGEAIAFHAPGIFSVKKKFRHTGLGKILVDDWIARARGDGRCALFVQCSPRTSLRFWQAMGFEEYHDPRSPDTLLAWRALEQKRVLSSASELHKVSISLYIAHSKIYNPSKQNVFKTFCTNAELHSNNYLLLSDRTIILLASTPLMMKVFIEIRLDGRIICNEHALSEEGEQFGINPDPSGGAVFIEDLYIP